MPKSLIAVTVVAEEPTARALWRRLGFALPADGGIALDSAAIAIVDRGEEPAPAPLSFTLADAPAKSHATAHPNGARTIVALVTIEDNPADHGEALGRVAGQREMRATSTGLELKLANTRWEVLTPTAFAQIYGEAAASRQKLEALVFAVRDLQATRAYLSAQRMAFADRMGRLVLAERPAGLILAFEAQ